MKTEPFWINEFARQARPKEWLTGSLSKKNSGQVTNLPDVKYIPTYTLPTIGKDSKGYGEDTRGVLILKIFIIDMFLVFWKIIKSCLYLNRPCEPTFFVQGTFPSLIMPILSIEQLMR